MIDTHQEMMLALAEAAELEHSLICQYLFAAYSLKTSSDGLSEAEATTIRGWRNKILDVARQEMGHLGTVWNLAALLGAAPNSGHVNFPQAGGRFYPPAIDFALTPFGDEALDRFIAFEEPEPVVLAIEPPEPIEYQRVGDLYRKIADAAASLPEKGLLIDIAAVGDSTAWANNVLLKTATTRQQVLEAIEFIIEQGEGTPQVTTGSHYQIFLDIKAELSAHLLAGGTNPAKTVVSNPWTVEHRDAEGGVLLSSAVAVRSVASFNLLYSSLLQGLRHYFSGSPRNDQQRRALKMACYKLMHNCLGPLGESLTDLPAHSPDDGLRAGPSFETFGHEDVSGSSAALWTILITRLDAVAAELRELAPQHARFADIANSAVQAAGWLKSDIPSATEN
jgi:hypothetical protein